jgi:hypothetical protein
VAQRDQRVNDCGAARWKPPGDERDCREHGCGDGEYAGCVGVTPNSRFRTRPETANAMTPPSAM